MCLLNSKHIILSVFFSRTKTLVSQSMLAGVTLMHERMHDIECDLTALVTRATMYVWQHAVFK